MHMLLLAAEHNLSTESQYENGTNQYRQVCVQPSTPSVDMKLPTFAAERPQLSINISSKPAGHCCCRR